MVMSMTIRVVTGCGGYATTHFPSNNRTYWQVHTHTTHTHTHTLHKLAYTHTNALGRTMHLFAKAQWFSSE